jgi:hypothetical protein
MAILQADLKFHYTGASSHEAAQGDGDLSLGNYRAADEISSGVDENVFDDVTGDEADTGDIEYRAIGFHNDHVSLILTACVIWIAVDTGNAEDDISYDGEAPSASEITGAIQTIANESTEPTSPDWQEGTTKGTGQDCPNASNQVVADGWFGIWLRRTISASAAAKTAETVTMRVEGDTAA